MNALKYLKDEGFFPVDHYRRVRARVRVKNVMTIHPSDPSILQSPQTIFDKALINRRSE